MRIAITCPAPPRTLYGNRVTALRWARVLRGLGHNVSILANWRGESCDLLLALHARKSAGSVVEFRRRHPEKPAVLALTGTDVYRDIHRSREAREALALATRLVVLQPLAIEELPPDCREKARVIYQSVAPTPSPGKAREPVIAVVGHLREVKDPFRAARASRLLPPESRIRVLHAGAAMDDHMEALARAEQVRNPRYRWLGAIPRWKARRLIASSRLLVLSSRMEGGANVISEALVDGVPVLASRISGSIGMLGEGYPGYFPTGDTHALRDLMWRAERDPAFWRQLKACCDARAPLFRPRREIMAWKSLLRKVRA